MVRNFNLDSKEVDCKQWDYATVFPFLQLVEIPHNLNTAVKFPTWPHRRIVMSDAPAAHIHRWRNGYVVKTKIPP